MNDLTNFNIELYEALKEAKEHDAANVDITFIEKNTFIKTKEFSFLPISYNTVGYTFKLCHDSLLENYRKKNPMFEVNDDGKLQLTTITPATYRINLIGVSLERLKEDLIDNEYNAKQLPYFEETSSETRDIRYIFDLLDAQEKFLNTNMEG